jgi:putative transposase
MNIGLANSFAKKGERTAREAISHSIQSYTATQCNRVLGRKGAFWQAETFDHFVRDADELLRVIHYIEQNPVVAGLVKEVADYPWSSARLRQRFGVKPGEAIPVEK